MPVLIKVFLDSCLVACFDDVLLDCEIVRKHFWIDQCGAGNIYIILGC